MTQKTILRVEHNSSNPFMMLERALPKNKAMSYEALGMLVYLLSQPDDWEVMPVDLQREGCGRDKVYTILRELRALGHVTLKQPQVDHRFTKPQYVVNERPEEPFTEKPYTPKPEAGKSPPNDPHPEKPDAALSPQNEPLPEIPDTAKPLTDLPDTESPDTANPHRQSTESLQNTDSDCLRESTEAEDARAREDAAAAAAEIESVEVGNENFHKTEDKTIFDYYLDEKFSPPLDGDIMRDALTDAAREFTPEQIKTAFTEAVLAGVRQWKYARKILDRLRDEAEQAALVQSEIDDVAFSLASPLRDTPDVPEAVDAAWTLCIRQLEQQFDRTTWNNFMRDLVLIGFEVETQTFVVGARNDGIVYTLQERLYRQIQPIFRTFYGAECALRFVPKPGQSDQVIFRRVAEVG